MYLNPFIFQLSEAKCQNASDSQRVMKQLFSKHKFPNETVIPAYSPKFVQELYIISDLPLWTVITQTEVG